MFKRMRIKTIMDDVTWSGTTIHMGVYANKALSAADAAKAAVARAKAAGFHVSDVSVNMNSARAAQVTMSLS